MKIRYLTPFGYLIGFAETLYAETRGFFAKQGLEVEIQGGAGRDGGSTSHCRERALSRTGGTDHIKAYAKDASLVAIAEIFQRDIFYVIAHADHPLRNPADFAGKTIGIVSDGGATENSAGHDARCDWRSGGSGSAPGGGQCAGRVRVGQTGTHCWLHRNQR